MMKLSILALFACVLNAAVIPEVKNVDKRAFSNLQGMKHMPYSTGYGRSKYSSPEPIKLKDNWLLNLNFKLPSKKN